MKHISELMFDAILESMLKRYSARYVTVYLKLKAEHYKKVELLESIARGTDEDEAGE